MKRRNFLSQAAVGSAAFLMPVNLLAGSPNKTSQNPLRFGICTDVHKDLMHDADERLQAFIHRASDQAFDFIIQLGDFCRPYDYNRGFMDIWNSFRGEKLHVLGNHDMDGGFTRTQVVKYWQARGTYYSLDINGFHLVILDGNDQDDSADRPAGYARFFGQEQLEWLEADLAQTELPTLVFSHQGIDNGLGGITNGTKTRLIFERANQQAGFQKVVAVFSGHHHQDYHNNYNGIHYIQINSMSYSWLGEKYQHIRYSEKIDEQYPWIKYTLPYRDPLWAEIQISTDQLMVKGRSTEFVGPSHIDLGMPEFEFGYPVVSKISDRHISLPGH